MDVLFENGSTWTIGLGSRNNLAAIISNRREAEAMTLGSKGVVKAVAIEEVDEDNRASRLR